MPELKNPAYLVKDVMMDVIFDSGLLVHFLPIAEEERFANGPERGGNKLIFLRTAQQDVAPFLRYSPEPVAKASQGLIPPPFLMRMHNVY